MTNLEVVLTIVLAIVILGTSLYIYTRPRYEYYKGEILVIESNFGDMFKSLTRESKGFTLRKSTKTGEWQVIRKEWYKSFGSYQPRFKWRKLLDPHLSIVKERLSKGEKVILTFE